MTNCNNNHNNNNSKSPPESSISNHDQGNRRQRRRIHHVNPDDRPPSTVQPITLDGVHFANRSAYPPPPPPEGGGGVAPQHRPVDVSSLLQLSSTMRNRNDSIPIASISSSSAAASSSSLVNHNSHLIYILDRALILCDECLNDIVMMEDDNEEETD